MKKLLLTSLLIFSLIGNCFAEYGSNFLTGGTASADTEFGANVASRAVDGNTVTGWVSTDSAFPHWWKYDLGAGVSKTAAKLRLNVAADPDYVRVKDFTLQGSNNDSAWDTVYTGQFPDNTTGWYDFTFSNSTAYRYYMVNITTSWEVDNNMSIIYETEMMEELAAAAPLGQIIWID